MSDTTKTEPSAKTQQGRKIKAMLRQGAARLARLHRDDPGLERLRQAVLGERGAD
jgi:hypothetical protein